MLKYQHIQPGTRIRAYDFKPREGVEDWFVEGVVECHIEHEGALFLEMIVDKDSSGVRVGERVGAAMETLYEFDGRIQVLEEASCVTSG